MSIITKAIAAEVAIKLTAKKEANIRNLSSDLRDVFTEMYLPTLPEDLLATFNKYPMYFETRSEFQLSGNGTNYEYFRTNRALPYSKRTFAPSEAQAAVLLKAYHIIKDAESELKSIRNEIEVTLNSLRSYKKITELFPEAAPFLPGKISNALAVNISDLQSRLKC